MNKEELIALAKEETKRSYSPYSNFAVGAALLTKDISESIQFIKNDCTGRHKKNAPAGSACKEPPEGDSCPAVRRPAASRPA